MGQKKSEIPGEVSILSAGVKIEGRIYSDGNMRVDGTVNGDITVNGNLTLGEQSVVKGDIQARNITASGKIEGSVKASEKFILESGSSLKGDLLTKVLVVEEGAQFYGNSVMNNNETTDNLSGD
jgi:cytoskeletal protein CcmA (bactofilin family)